VLQAGDADGKRRQSFLRFTSIFFSPDETFFLPSSRIGTSRETVQKFGL
jgi:hypothetical protein